MQRVISLVILFFCISGAYGQKLDSVASKLHNYGQHGASSTLFVHFDKNVYTNNDQVWFTGYLLKSITNVDHYHTLYLSLINNQDSSVVVQRKFLIERGICFGNLTLPDSLPGGSYRFVAQTNIRYNQKYDGMFIQPVTIKSTTINPLTASVSIFKKYNEQSKNGTALLKVLTSNNRFVEGADIQFTIGRNNIIKSGSARSSVIGELMIDYPAREINAENNLLKVTVRKGNQVRYVQYELPYDSRPEYDVKFYPEGGYLISGINKKVGIEIKDSKGASVKANAVLFNGDLILDTIRTNSAGLGSFSITPSSGLNYKVRILGNAGNESYPLPGVLVNGISISTAEHICDNVFRVQLQSNRAEKVNVVLHNYSEIFLQTTILLKAGKQQAVRFELDSVPPGLNSVTLLDSLYRPIAEKVFFAHYDRIQQLDIHTDKENYFTRDSVKLTIDLRNQPGWESGLVSVACVQANRLSFTNEKNIIDYAYLERELGALPFRPEGLKFSDREYLNNLLMVKGWSRYKWPMEEQRENVSPLSLELTGDIKKGKRILKAPVTLFTLAGTNINSFKTDSTGKFSIPYAYLLANEKGKVWLNIQDKNPTGYSLTISDPMDSIKRKLPLIPYQMQTSLMTTINEGTETQQISSGIKLKEVTIKATRDDGIGYQQFNECGDYVCPYNILNCPNHPGNPGNHAPVKGKTYGNGGRGGTIMYMGCTGYQPKPSVYILNGINLPKEFYVSDITNKNEPINFATVYWNYQTKLTEGKISSLTFNTGDLTGKFKIVVQGVTVNGVVYGEQFIEVMRR